jgi:hypothetical protein
MREAISFLVSVLIVLASCLGPVRAQTTSEREIDAIKQDVSRLYSATDKKIAVKMRSGTRLKGYIRAVGSDTFTLRTRPNSDTEVRYADVARVSRTGLSKGQKIAIFGGIMGAAVVAGIVFRPKGRGGLRCLLCN